MPKTKFFTDLVFNMNNKVFELFQEVISARNNKERYGVSNFVELGVKYNRIPSCPKCGSTDHKPSSHTPQGLHRYLCNGCGCRYALMSNSIFYSSKKGFNIWVNYLTLMTFNVPLEMTEEIFDISHPTAMLWREKVFSTVDGYQEHLYLKDCVWIDETFIYDGSLLHDDSYKKKRGLSKNQLCIVVAIDYHKNIYAVICGHGKPSASRIIEALKNRSTLVHDTKEHMTS